MNSIFGVKHLVLLAASVALMVALVALFRRLDSKRLCKVMLCIGLVSETIKIFYYILQNEEKYGGILPKSDLPFHLCSIQILFILILNMSESERVHRVLLSFMYPSCLIGGIAAILLPTTSALNGLWIITAQYFVYHIAISAFAIRIVSDKERQLTLGDFASCLKFLVAVFFFAVYINSIVYDGTESINFMYVVSPPQSGLPFLNEEHGWLVYIIHYACLAIFVVSLCYAKPIIEAAKGKVLKIKGKAVEGEEEDNESNNA